MDDDDDDDADSLVDCAPRSWPWLRVDASAWEWLYMVAQIRIARIHVSVDSDRDGLGKSYHDVWVVNKQSVYEGYN